MKIQRVVFNCMNFAKLFCIYGYTVIGFSSARILPNNRNIEYQSNDLSSNISDHGSSTPVDIDSLIQRLISFPPTVSYTITSPMRRHGRHRSSVPLKPDMTVLHGLISAVRSNSDSTNPFNVQLLWESSLECYVIHKALGVSRDESYNWTIKVRDWKKQTVYKGRCMPRETIKLGPFYKVNIQYQHTDSS